MSLGMAESVSEDKSYQFIDNEKWFEESIKPGFANVFGKWLALGIVPEGLRDLIQQGNEYGGENGLGPSSILDNALFVCEEAGMRIPLNLVLWQRVRQEMEKWGDKPRGGKWTAKFIAELTEPRRLLSFVLARAQVVARENPHSTMLAAWSNTAHHLDEVLRENKGR